MNKEKGIAINEEVLDEKVLKDLNVSKDEMKKVKSSEVGNIFNFGTSKCDDMKFFTTNKEGEKIPIYLGSYGIGITRLMGVIAEHFADENGMVWPEAVAPFKVHLLSLGENEKAEEIYNELTKNNIEVLYDDREVSAGEKFADSDLIGIPYRLVISKKSLASGGVEIKKRSEKESRIIKTEDILKELK